MSRNPRLGMPAVVGATVARPADTKVDALWQVPVDITRSPHLIEVERSVG